MTEQERMDQLKQLVVEGNELFDSLTDESDTDLEVGTAERETVAAWSGQVYELLPPPERGDFGQPGGPRQLVPNEYGHTMARNRLWHELEELQIIIQRAEDDYS